MLRLRVKALEQPASASQRRGRLGRAGLGLLLRDWPMLWKEITAEAGGRRGLARVFVNSCLLAVLAVPVLQVVYYQKYPNASTDLRAPLTETKGKNPDLFLNSGHLQESLAIMQQAKELGFSPKGFAFSVGPGTPDFQTTLQNDANFVMGGVQWTPALKYQGDDLFKTPADYNALYKQTFNYEPAYQSADATVSGVAFAKAIETAGSTDTEKVRDTIAKLNFTSFYGVVKFDERGINVDKPMAVEQWQNGHRATVWPADVAETKALWPMPSWSTR